MSEVTYCVRCGTDETVKTETGNEDCDLFAAEDTHGSIEYYAELEIWHCNKCDEDFFK